MLRVVGIIGLRKSKSPASEPAEPGFAYKESAGDLPVQRSPTLVLIVTGTGMRGELENALRDRVAHMFRPPVPVLVHRYGVARSGSLFRPCQRVATRRVAARLRELSEGSGSPSSPPDIIAHSFGAWLIGQALRQNPDIRVGRIIMAGSVLRPDFDWRTLIERGQVEAVLNHYGSRDLWAFVSEFFIPDSGPAGFRGFAQCRGVVNYREPGFRHITFFLERHIESVHRTLWRPFLTMPVGELARLATIQDSPLWHQRPWLLRANLLRFLLLAGLMIGVAELLLGVVRLMASAAL